MPVSRKPEEFLWQQGGPALAGPAGSGLIGGGL